MEPKPRKEASLVFKDENDNVVTYQHPGYTEWFVESLFIKEGRRECATLSDQQRLALIARIEHELETFWGDELQRRKIAGRLHGLKTFSPESVRDLSSH